MREKSILKSLVFLFLSFIAGALILGLFFGPTETNYLKISYNQLLDQAEAQNIASIAVDSNGYIDGLLEKPVQNKTSFKIQVPTATLNVLVAKVRESNPRAEIVFRSNSPWLSLLNWIPLLILGAFFIFMIRRLQNMQAGGKGLMRFGSSRAKLANNSSKKVTFEDVAGVEEAKSELQETIDFLKNPAKFAKLGGRLPKGVLLVGPPGTGKTLLARAVAGEANVPFYSISGSDFVEMFVGVGAARVRDLFEQGKKNSPCIIFIDELDAVGRHRGTGIGGGHDEREQTLNQLLVDMDGFEGNEGTILIASTNRPDVLDPALLRPGRFDRTVIVNRPDIKGREEILKIHTRKVVCDENVKLLDIARGTPGFSGADLSNLVNEAALNAARYNNKTVTQKDFEFAKDKVTMGGERRTLVISDKEKETTAIHEAGHAILTLLLPNADPLHKVTIIPRGMALGLTYQLPTEDRHNYSREYLESQLIILMGGRCAEEVILNQQTTGAKNDLERASDLAKQMVCEWGMSKLGPLSFASEESELFLGRRLAEKSNNYSEATAKEIDETIRDLVITSYGTARDFIEVNKDKVKKIAKALIEKETLDGEEIRKLIKIA